MIKRVDDRPDAFSHINGQYAWFELFDSSDSLYAYLAIQMGVINAETHIEMVKWSNGIRKQLMNSELPKVKAMSKKNGIEKLVFKKLAPDEKWEKFIRLLGVSEPVTYMAAYLEV